eukprot:m.375014 g.375014  ORF g.375014 m.375014 type:complete len:316 (+) comp20911_c0_seq1:85-1032(+)
MLTMCATRISHHVHHRHMMYEMCCENSQGISSYTPVPTALRASKSFPSTDSRELISTRTPPTQPGRVGLSNRATGLRRNTIWQYLLTGSVAFVVFPSSPAAILHMSSILRLRRRWEAIHALSSSENATSSAAIVVTQPGRRACSRISLIVNAASMGPRRPTTITFLMALSRNACTAAEVMSVGASMVSTGEVSTRATSRATLPCPITTAVFAEDISGASARKSGCPLYHPTNSLAECTPRSEFETELGGTESPVGSPSIPSLRSLWTPYARTTAVYLSCSSATLTCLPSATFPKYSQRAFVATASNCSVQFLTSG